MKKRLNIVFVAGLITMATFVQMGVRAATPADKSVTKKFRTQVEDVVKAYLQVKDALGESKAEQATKAAKKLSKELSTVDVKLLTKANQNKWQKHADVLRKNTEVIAKSSDLNDQRKALLALSEQVDAVAKEFGPLSITLYRQFCPMAFNKEGGYWFSDSKEILNPYLGANMPTCGVLKETIKAGK